MQNNIVELRQRLARALDLRECGSAVATDGSVIKYYLDAENNPMGLVRDWLPDAPEKILKVIELYGLHVERTVHPHHKPKPGEEAKIVWQYNVWSRNPIYRSLSQDYGRLLRNGPRIVGPDLTTAVLTWAVLRAERVKTLRESKLEASMYNFNTLREKVYVSPAQ